MRNETDPTAHVQWAALRDVTAEYAPVLGLPSEAEMRRVSISLARDMVDDPQWSAFMLGSLSVLAPHAFAEANAAYCHNFDETGKRITRERS